MLHFIRDAIKIIEDILTSLNVYPDSLIKQSSMDLIAIVAI